MEYEDQESNYIAAAEIEAKKAFLQDEIKDMNYDTDLFTAFFMHKTDQGDLEDVTFQELQEVVREFKSRFRAGETLAQVEEQKRKEEQRQRRLYEVPIQKRYQRKPTETDQPNQPQQVLNPPDKISNSPDSSQQQEKPIQILQSPEPQVPQQKKIPPPTPIMQVLPQQNKQQTYSVRCQMPAPTQLSGRTGLEIIISEPQLVQGGIFSKNYTVYGLSTPSEGWSVKRRFKEFEWLRQVLFLRFPGIFIPPLPPKRSRGRLQNDTIKKRQNLLARFINGLTRNPLFLTSIPFVVFLKQDQPKIFAKQQKEFKKLRKADSVSQMYSLTGELECTENQAFVPIINDYISQSEIIKKKMKRGSETIMTAMANLSSCLSQYGQTLQQLQKLQSRLPQNSANKSLYAALAQLFHSLSQYQKEKIQTFSIGFNIFFKYAYKQQGVLKQLIRERESIANAYKKAEAKARISEQQQQLFGFYNKSVVEQTRWVAQDNLEQGISHFSSISSHEAQQATKLHMIWGSLLARLTDISDINPTFSN